MNRSFSSITLAILSFAVYAQSTSIEAEAIDLGLSVKWASHNVGASTPEGYGNLYGWGQPDSDITTQNLDNYPSATPPASISGSEHDIATVNWGKEWRMPTQAEWEELAAKCAWEWSTVGGINGMTVTGTNGNSIFLPAGASRTGDNVSNQVGQRGNYWSGSLWPDNNNFASYLYFYSDASRVQPARSNRRYIGMSVRPVFAGEDSGINAISVERTSVFSAVADGAYIQVEHIADDATIAIYDTMGRTIYSGKKHRVLVGKSGIYLINADNFTKKVIIR